MDRYLLSEIREIVREELRATQSSVFRLTDSQENLLALLLCKHPQPSSHGLSLRHIIKELFTYEIKLPRRWGKTYLLNYMERNYNCINMRYPPDSERLCGITLDIDFILIDGSTCSVEKTIDWLTPFLSPDKIPKIVRLYS